MVVKVTIILRRRRRRRNPSTAAPIAPIVVASGAKQTHAPPRDAKMLFVSLRFS